MPEIKKKDDNSSRPWRRFAFTFLLALLPLLFHSCHTNSPPEVEKQEVRLPDSELEDATIVFTIQGVQRMLLQADYIARYEKEDSTSARVVHADFYDEEGEHSSVLTSKFGIIKEKTKELWVSGEVVVITDEGVKLETETLRWDPNIDRIITDDFVKVTRKEDILTGYGMEADQELKNIKIKREVKGILRDVPSREELEEMEEEKPESTSLVDTAEVEEPTAIIDSVQ
jgi:LPS export ABC transporter protein LptC